MEDQESVSIKKAIDDLLQTSILKEVAKRNNQEFAQHLATWIVRYILVISSMKSSLKISFEETLFNLHGEKFRKILEVTEKIFHKIHDDTESDTSYIR
jgi:diketogulonate reductase-like aldo/keto reductase